MSPLFRLTLNGKNRNCHCPSISPQPISLSCKLADFQMSAPISLCLKVSSGCQGPLFLLSSWWEVVGNSHPQEQPSSFSQGMTERRRWVKHPSSLSSWRILRCAFHVGPSRLYRQLSSVVTCLITLFMGCLPKPVSLPYSLTDVYFLGTPPSYLNLKF